MAFSYISFNSRAFDATTAARNSSNDLTQDTDKLLQRAATKNTSVARKMREFRVATKKVATGTKALADKLQRQGIDLDQLSARLAPEIHTILEELKREFPQPLPEHETPTQAHRNQMISRTLSKLENAVVKVIALWDVPPDSSRALFKELEPHVKRALFITGTIRLKHPNSY